MREIKFRAWDIKYKEMTEKFSVLNAPGMINRRIDNGDKFVILQFAGLHDKNGNEIYEGDIVKGYWWDKGKQHRHIGRVAYVMNAFNVRGVKQYLGYDDGLNPSYEVIGNIYENPELVGEQNERD